MNGVPARRWVAVGERVMAWRGGAEEVEEWEEDPEQARADEEAEEEGKSGEVDEAELRKAVERAKEMDEDIAAGAEACRTPLTLNPGPCPHRNNRNIRSSRSCHIGRNGRAYAGWAR
jgi:hypothetical protein